MKNLVLRLQPPGTFMTLADYLALLPTPKVVELKENERVRVARQWQDPNDKSWTEACRAVADRSK
jgi:hypothetical protein